MSDPKAPSTQASAPNPPSAYAVIIGVSRYRSYDSTGGNDLAGARNDAIAWWRHLVLHLKFPAEQVRTLTSPPLAPEELGHTPDARRLAGLSPKVSAKQEDIEEAYNWLYERLGSNKDSVGVFTYSGHGSTHLPQDTTRFEEPDGLHLCASDYTVTAAGRPSGHVMVESFFRDREAAITERITYLLDTCYATEATSTSARADLRRLPIRGLPRTNTPITREGATLSQTFHPRTWLAHGRVMLGAHLQNLAHEVLIGGQLRGAWSWALLSMMEQWRLAPIFPEQPLGPKHPLVRYRDLNFASRAQLSLLNLLQVPHLAGREVLQELVMFQRTSQPPVMGLSDVPDASAPGSQLTGEANGITQYEIIAGAAGAGADLALVLSGRSQSASPGSRGEHWYTNSTTVNQLSTATAIRLKTVGGLKWSGWTASDSSSYVSQVSDQVVFAQNGASFDINGNPLDWPTSYSQIIPINVTNWSTSWAANLPAGLINWFVASGPGNNFALGFVVANLALTHICWAATSNNKTVNGNHFVPAGDRFKKFTNTSVILTKPPSLQASNYSYGIVFDVSTS